MKNRILKGVTGLAVMVSLLAMCAVDGDFRIYALWALAIAGVWLGLFYFANRRHLERR